MTDDLTPESVTTASRLMLPAYPLLAAIIGINYLLTSDDRLLESPVFRVADNLLPMAAWGAFFLAISAAQVGALLVQRRWAYIVTLSCMTAGMLVWGSIFAVAAVYGEASPSAWAWPVFTATACWASIRSLTRETR